MKTSNALLLGGFSAAALFLVVHIALAKGELASPIALSGERTTERYDLPALQHLNFEGPIRLILTAGLPSVTIEADKSLQAELKDLDDDPSTLKLVVPKAGRNLGTNDVIVARISAPNLRTMRLSGATEVSSTEPLDYRSLFLDINGAPRMDLEFTQLDSLRVEGTGSMEGSLRGRATNFSYSGSGSSDIDASTLVTSFTRVAVSGSGKVRVHADSLLSVEGAGSMDIEYSGAARISSKISGSGSVRAVE